MKLQMTTAINNIAFFLQNMSTIPLIIRQHHKVKLNILTFPSHTVTQHLTLQYYKHREQYMFLLEIQLTNGVMQLSTLGTKEG